MTTSTAALHVAYETGTLESAADLCRDVSPSVTWPSPQSPPSLAAPTSFAARLQNRDPPPSLPSSPRTAAQILSTKTTGCPCSICRSILHPPISTHLDRTL
ncbi:hypothetical protein A1O3_06263 [Capronia epimyces CBS 606.96]|uniref:Uncharacterized protein n=1 Tax=Capronia epimyces CBS 606.96 TaxID=1182542 RepID=W9XYK6_9EURO|nr:uncharacterized protein A1O3_06263 [Capronia epimyces CBS 606.96]EXJ82450.1 hypothetical protein A1O3_06263 [Capronia epimyces CBS 606.96]